MAARSAEGAAAPDSDERRLADLETRFRRHAEAVGVRIERVAGSADAATIIAALAVEEGAASPLLAAELRAAAPLLIAALEALGQTWQSPSGPAATKDAPLGVSLASLAVAETGSVLLAEGTLEARAIGMLVASHVVVCPTGALVPSLDEAAPALRAVAGRPGGSYATLVTGPSRTADIERVLTVGVQGPARLTVVFVDDLR